jgi:3-methylcrotonyl-CoA carboxylase alpha subunit
MGARIGYAVMFERLLIANRGEIACRVMKTARRLGIRTIAVYSDADVDALHVRLADEAWAIGPPPAQQSYLNIEKIVETALSANADAIHPGYGFLAENPEFAECCLNAGLIFIGPSPRTMRIMGSKARAKSLMESVGAPVVPGYHGEATDATTLADAAGRIGFPLLVKASAGGGGRGMRVVTSPDQLASAIASAEREAYASFGDGRLLLEKYLESPRHIEVQIFGDSKGDAISFSERDCSIQRRHQKIVEETPAPLLSTSLSQNMREVATVAAKAIGYVGAGTVEFLVQREQFYFLEMNTRLQVEHPVTEMIFGQDLVEWQLRIACGEDLPLSQKNLTMRGCAIEVRICAEDPLRDFLPSVGIIERFLLPHQGAAIRVDAGVQCGDRVTQYYDSLIAKLIVWGINREDAVRRIKAALDAFETVGIATNLDFLRAIVHDARFKAGKYDTEFIKRNFDELIVASQAKSDRMTIVAAGVAAWFDELRRREHTLAGEEGDETSPWALADGWRMLEEPSCELDFLVDGEALKARVNPFSPTSFSIEFERKNALIRFEMLDARVRLWMEGLSFDLGVQYRSSGLVIISNGRNHYLDYIDPLRCALGENGEDVQLLAPLPGRIIRVYVRAGDRVSKGAQLVTIEAMKMEINLSAPKDGVVERILCAEGDMTREGSELILFAEGEPA